MLDRKPYIQRAEPRDEVTRGQRVTVITGNVPLRGQLQHELFAFFIVTIGWPAGQG